jgi:hypothetical protein
VDKVGLTGCNPYATPMEPRLRLSKESSSPLVDGTTYRSLVGSMRYLVNTRPDLAFLVGYVSRFMKQPTEEHLVVVKRIIRYVASTLNLGCQYGRDDQWNLIGYCDNDIAGDIDSSKSTTGVAYFHGKNMISC